MKIRTGFVSNSSSASFIVSIKNKKFSDIVTVLIDESIEPFSYLQDITSLDFIEKIRKNIVNESVFYSSKRKIETLAEYENLLKRKSKEDIAYFIFKKVYGIKIKEEDENIHLRWDTSMLNNYNESTPDIIKNLCLYSNITKEFEMEIVVKEM